MNNSHYLFGIPVYNNNVTGDKFDAVQNEIGKVLEDTERTQSFRRPDGWNSSTQLVSDPTFSTDFISKCPSFKQELHYHICNFLDNIESSANVNNYKITASWITQTKKGQYAHTHNHGDSDLAGVYYFKTNGADGNIFFDSPVEVLKNSFCFRQLHQRLKYSPEEGKIILFPAWLNHGVSENTTDHERISISFNIIFNRFNRNSY